MGRTWVLEDVTEQWDYATLDPSYVWTFCYKNETTPLLFRSLLFGFFLLLVAKALCYREKVMSLALNAEFEFLWDTRGKARCERRGCFST